MLHGAKGGCRGCFEYQAAAGSGSTESDSWTLPYSWMCCSVHFHATLLIRLPCAACCESGPLTHKRALLYIARPLFLFYVPCATFPARIMLLFLKSCQSAVAWISSLRDTAGSLQILVTNSFLPIALYDEIFRNSSCLV